MNKFFLSILIASLSVLFSTQIYASSSHDTLSSHTMDDSKTMESEHGDQASGMKIRASTKDGYTLEYRLIDMREKIKNLKNMPEMKDTHHLMVFIKDSHGTAIDKAKVGYFIRGKESGSAQKKMAMSMGGGFGADVTLSSGKHYMIKTKIIAGEKKLVDEFKYMGGDH